MIKKVLLAAMLAASFGGIATSVTAATVIVRVAPPTAPSRGRAPAAPWLCVGFRSLGMEKSTASMGQGYLDTRTPRVYVQPADMGGA